MLDGASITLELNAVGLGMGVVLGLLAGQAIRHIILPQALRLVW